MAQEQTATPDIVLTATAATSASTAIASSASLSTTNVSKVRPIFGDLSEINGEPAVATAASANPRLTDRIQGVLSKAMTLLGTPYRWGGESEQGGFDCSGLVGYVYRTVLGMELPRVSRQMARTGEAVDRTALAPGDLVFFGRRGRVSHVGIYVGEGRFVHAPSTGGTVRLDRLDGPYWRDHYSGAVRVLH